MTLQKKIAKLAELSIKVGLNVLPGDTVQIYVPVDRADLAREVVKEAYMAGAKNVIVEWEDDAKKLMDYTYKTTEDLQEVADYDYKKAETLLKNGVKQLFISGVNPELLKDIDPKKIHAVANSLSKKMSNLKKYRMNDITSWTIISAPTEGWAKKVFPNSENPIDDLWEAIFETTRVNKENPVQSWKDNIATLTEKANWLNEMDFKSLHYTSSNGTNLTIGLPNGHIWRAASTQNAKGEAFLPNMPTEEVYTMPMRDKVDGKIFSSKPLANNGNIIDEFWVEFKDGVVVDFDAKVGKQALEELLNQDEDRSRRLGEVALVPFDSPISNSNILFFNTLFDENASCHLALGAAYPTTIKGGNDMTAEELEKNSVNQSIIHVDFMVGTKDLNIIGKKKDGTEVQVFKDGNWA
ncbi:aminopeptidase [Helcococcus ovis]|uniref:Aminopeptidase n=1 Tax=Helcococcus ovis TaxID=72026 RepID=A0A4R9C490_9FIRM|nr:aminopeptidase [Helcococcus ovis]TFF65111.1 aminopeptidase [Helcococcus ovis]TFF66066.1 aminopeptidase [Helcococcus ovis]TFF66755.1 aminopeptidase [Helcococcus ovis]WNZ01521.1 aminopeptidase [Helcococcus ovis]